VKDTSQRGIKQLFWRTEFGLYLCFAKPVLSLSANCGIAQSCDEEVDWIAKLRWLGAQSVFFKEGEHQLFKPRESTCDPELSRCQLPRLDGGELLRRIATGSRGIREAFRRELSGHSFRHTAGALAF
jgi:hypothetical protein